MTYLDVIQKLGRIQSNKFSCGGRNEGGIRKALSELLDLCNSSNYAEIEQYLQNRIRDYEKMNASTYVINSSRAYSKKNLNAINRAKASFLKAYRGALETLQSEKGADIVEVSWETVHFYLNRISFASQEKRYTCQLVGAKEIYNTFISSIRERLPNLKVKLFERKPPIVVKDANFDVVFQYLQVRDALQNNDRETIQKLPQLIVAAPFQFQDTFLPKTKNKYIQYLVDNQSPDYRFVPLFEKSLTYNEDAFLFTIKKRSLIIVWENLSENTATFVFKCNQSNHDEVLQRVYDYACSDINYKRLRLHPNKLNPIIGLKYDIVYHNDFCEWRNILENI